jgi:hypothetical protein
MWTNQNSDALIKLRLNNALKQYDFTNVYKYVFEYNLMTEYTNMLLNLMVGNEFNSFNHSALKFIEDMIIQGYYDPLPWLIRHYKLFGNSNVMNVIQHILIAVKEREEKVKQLKNILNEEFGDVGKYVVSQYL